MSPLIDCVFLLLIFFLVTTMLKRKEKQIVVEMPDSTASVAVETREEQLLIGLDASGAALAPLDARDKDGGILWRPIDDLAIHLKEIVEARGPAALDLPLQINAHREAPFQKAIDALDLCKLQGFRQVSVKTRQPAALKAEDR